MSDSAVFAIFCHVSASASAADTIAQGLYFDCADAVCAHAAPATSSRITENFKELGRISHLVRTFYSLLHCEDTACPFCFSLALAESSECATILSVCSRW